MDRWDPATTEPTLAAAPDGHGGSLATGNGSSRDSSVVDLDAQNLHVGLDRQCAAIQRDDWAAGGAMSRLKIEVRVGIPSGKNELRLRFFGIWGSGVGIASGKNTPPAVSCHRP